MAINASCPALRQPLPLVLEKRRTDVGDVEDVVGGPEPVRLVQAMVRGVVRDRVEVGRVVEHGHGPALDRLARQHRVLLLVV